MDSPYKRNKYRKKKTSKTQLQTHTTSGRAKNVRNKKEQYIEKR